MTTKEDVSRNASKISSVIQGIGKQIVENKRQGIVKKVLEEYNNPKTLFYNEDGSPKQSDEILPKMTEGIFKLTQLGEGNLANSLMDYYTTMDKTFNSQAQNQFNYQGNKNDERFPVDEQGNPVQPNSRVQYPDWTGTKQYAPRDKKFYAPKSVNLGDRVQIYEWDADKQIWTMRTEDFNKPANINYNYSSVNTTVSGQEQMASYTDNNGKVQNVVYKDGVPYYSGTNQKVKNMEGWIPNTENAPIPGTEPSKSMSPSSYNSAIEGISGSIGNLGNSMGFDGEQMTKVLMGSPSWGTVDYLLRQMYGNDPTGLSQARETYWNLAKQYGLFGAK